MRQIILVALLTLVLVQGALAQRGSGSPNQNSAPGGVAQSSGGQPSAPASDELARMQDDLNKLESLNLNMSSEIEFLRDQNLQILLRTNAQMWTIVIRDMREQINREEQRKGVAPAQPLRPGR